MTPNISQHVMPRAPIASSYGRFRAQRRGPMRVSSRLSTRMANYEWQRGSVNSATLSLVVGIVIIIGVTFLSFFYLGQVLGTAAQSTDIQALENQLVELKERQREVELEGARLRSIEAIEAKVQELNLETSNQVTYLQAQPDRVATLPENQ